PLNGRIAWSDRLAQGNVAEDTLLIYGWGKGENLPSSQDLGYTGIQRYGGLALTAYSGSGTTTIDPKTGGRPIPTRLRRFNFNGASGFLPCAGYSGEPLLGNVNGLLDVTFGVNKTGVDPTPCQSGSVSAGSTGSAHAWEDFSIGQLIFELERSKGFANP